MTSLPFRIDPDKPLSEQKFVTRDGRPARVIATDLKDESHPIVALISRSDGSEYVYTMSLGGNRPHRYDEDDLFCVAPNPAPWIVYQVEPALVHSYATETEAREAIRKHGRGCNAILLRTEPVEVSS